MSPVERECRHYLYWRVAFGLQKNAGFSVETVADLPQALDCITAATDQFDLVVLDYGMPGMNGYAGLERAIAASDGRPVALMSGLAPAGVADKVLAVGAAGYLPKTLPARSLVNAIRFMAAGEVYMPLDLYRPSRAVETSPSGLSPRELEVLAGLCAGRANKEIARDLNLREPTIKLHVKTICRKLDAKNRTHAAMIARERSLCHGSVGL
jgi:DNA-binding NarL/FixJ family response regulator